MVPNGSSTPHSATPSLCDTKLSSKTKVDVEASLPVPEKAISSSVEPNFSSPTGWRKVAIISVLCSAQFFDIFNACASITALPSIGEHLGFTSGVLQWVLAAYTLTFGALQVPAGRLSDIYHPKPVFCIGYLALGIFSILCAVSVHPIMLIVFRAMSGIGAAMTIPSAIAMIVQTFRDPAEQSFVLGLYGAAGAVGNASGFVIGGIVSAKASWRWVFYIIAIAAIPFSILAALFLPRTAIEARDAKRELDLPGISVLTAGLILFVYALSDSNDQGWGSPQIIVTLILSAVFLAAFFFIERIVKDPALPPKTWRLKNFAAMFFYSLSPYWNLFAMEVQMTSVFQDLWMWSPFKSALHFLPLGITGAIVTTLTGAYGHLVPRRIALAVGQLFMLTASVLFALASTPDRYWSYIVPGMILNMIGLGVSYTGAISTTMAGAPKGEEGVVSAVLYTIFQVGSTLGIAVAGAISLGVNEKLPLDPISQHTGYAASFWSLVGMHGLMTIIAVIFVKD
ncbi:MFS general substrate transporter [Panus rudis PR-1116 ss-1]|nr:MFS general substrate transporter [Panus rudis PR-1116 ss-1]